jgi:hypothetical protein
MILFIPLYLHTETKNKLWMHLEKSLIREAVENLPNLEVLNVMLSTHLDNEKSKY